MTDDDVWTTRDAVDNLDPAMSADEVRIMVRLMQIAKVGILRGRPPAAVYRAADMQRAHAIIMHARRALSRPDPGTSA